MHPIRTLPCLLLLLIPALPCRAAASVIEWDFTTGRHGWVGNPHVQTLEQTSEGLELTTTGNDPWIEGPPFDVPATGLLRVTVEMSTDADAVAQVFYGAAFEAGRSQTFAISNDGRMHSYTFVIPDSTGSNTRLRLDPCQRPGQVRVRRVRIEPLQRPAAPVFAPASRFAPASGTPSVRAGDLTVACSTNSWNRIVVRQGDRELARGYEGELIGLQIDGRTEYLQLDGGSLRVEAPPEGGIRLSTHVRDSGGAVWTVSRGFRPHPAGTAIEVESAVSVNRERDAVLLPWLTLLPGHGSFGARKHQGLFAGLEYLSDEPSSSTADLSGPAHLRRVPAPVKVTFPLMAIGHEGRYIGLIWDPFGPVAAGFDSPDRIFGSGGHALWLSGPAVGHERFENDLVASIPVRLKAGAIMAVRVQIIAGLSPNVTGAVRHYLSLHPLPKLPAFEGGFERAVELLARGWLDSAAHVDGRYRHAVWMDRFEPQASAGPALYQSWLSHHVSDARLSARLQEGARAALRHVSANDPHASDVSHVRLPSPALVFGRVPEYLRQRRDSAMAQLGRFDAQGRVLYRPGQTDFSRTHFETHANGLGGGILANILETATLCPDPILTRRALALLDQQTRLYGNTVPRGAQTWEVPLHTPDILASAHMTRAYVLGFVLTGREDYLDQARYWAWTGVPFVYLTNPAGGGCGPYATIAVYGATSWVAPVWLGLPVQWCGLVYGSSLHLLSRYDPAGPWKELARGITLAGLQMTWTESDLERQGLLPDFMHLDTQIGDGPAINPGTVGAHLPEAFGEGPLYDVKQFSNGWIVHAPCAIAGGKEMEDAMEFTTRGWGADQYHVAVVGVRKPPLKVRVNGVAAEPSYHEDLGLLDLTVEGPATVRIEQ